jgi:hypothetical protein
LQNKAKLKLFSAGFALVSTTPPAHKSPKAPISHIKYHHECGITCHHAEYGMSWHDIMQNIALNVLIQSMALCVTMQNMALSVIMQMWK